MSQLCNLALLLPNLVLQAFSVLLQLLSSHFYHVMLILVLFFVITSWSIKFIQTQINLFMSLHVELSHFHHVTSELVTFHHVAFKLVTCHRLFQSCKSLFQSSHCQFIVAIDCFNVLLSYPNGVKRLLLHFRSQSSFTIGWFDAFLSHSQVVIRLFQCFHAKSYVEFSHFNTYSH